MATENAECSDANVEHAVKKLRSEADCDLMILKADQCRENATDDVGSADDTAVSVLKVGCGQSAPKVDNGQCAAQKDSRIITDADDDTPQKTCKSTIPEIKDSGECRVKKAVNHDVPKFACVQNGKIFKRVEEES